MADTNLDILIKIAAQGGPQAEAVIKQLNQAAADGSKDAAAALQKLGLAQKQQTAELAKVIPVQQEETKQTEKATEAKKSFRDGLRGVATAFPQLTQLLTAASSGWGLLAAAAAAGAKIVVSRLQEMAAQRAAAAALAREIELLGGSLTSTQEIMAREAAITEAFVAEMKTRGDAVDELRKKLAELNKGGQRTGAQNEKIDDDILRDRLIEIDEMNIPDSEKGLLRRKATSDAKLRGEKNRIEGIAKGSRTDFADASKFESLEKELLGKAAGEDQNVSAAERNFEIAGKEKEKADKFVAAQKLEIEEQLKWIRQGLKQSGGTFHNGYLYTPGRLKLEEQYYLDKEKGLEGSTKTQDADFKTAKEALEAAQKKKQGYLDAAKEAGGEAGKLMDSGRAKRGEYESEIRHFGDREPSIRAMDDRESRNIYKKEWEREQEEKKREEERKRSEQNSGGGSGSGGGYGGGGFGDGETIGALDDVTQSTGELTTSIEGFASASLQMHSRTAELLSSQAREIQSLKERLAGFSVVAAMIPHLQNQIRDNMI